MGVAASGMERTFSVYVLIKESEEERAREEKKERRDVTKQRKKSKRKSKSKRGGGLLGSVEQRQTAPSAPHLKDGGARCAGFQVHLVSILGKGVFLCLRQIHPLGAAWELGAGVLEARAEVGQEKRSWQKR